jgi:hypothetical protein
LKNASRYSGIQVQGKRKFLPATAIGGLKFEPDIPPMAGGKRGRFAKISCLKASNIYKYTRIMLRIKGFLQDHHLYRKDKYLQ